MVTQAAVRIGVAGQPANTDDESRHDASSGVALTITSLRGPAGAVHTLEFFNMWPGATALPVKTLVTTGTYANRQWTCNMPAVTWCTLGIRVRVQVGRSYSTVERIVATPAPGTGLVMPLFGERANPLKTRANDGAVMRRLSTDNTDDNADGWAQKIQSLYEYVQTLGVGGAVPAGRTITTTAPLLIGGGASADLSANRTLSIAAASGAAAGSMSAADKTKLDAIPSPASLVTTATALVGDVGGTVGANTIAAGSIGATKLANGSVTGAKIALASQADGDVMYYEAASSSWKRVANPNNVAFALRGSNPPTYGSVGPSTTNEYSYVIFVGAVTNSVAYTLYLRTGPDTTNTTITITSTGSASSTNIRDALIAVFQGLGYTAVAAGTLPGCFKVTRPGVDFDLQTTDLKLGLIRCTQGRGIEYATTVAANENSSLGFFINAPAYEINTPATTFTDFYPASGSGGAAGNRCSVAMLAGLRTVLGLSTTDLPDGTWHFEGTFSGNIAGGQSILIWRSPQGPDDTAGSDRRNVFSLSGGSPNGGVYERFKTDHNGRVWVRKTSGVLGYATAHAITGYRVDAP